MLYIHLDRKKALTAKGRALDRLFMPSIMPLRKAHLTEMRTEEWERMCQRILLIMNRVITDASAELGGAKWANESIILGLVFDRRW